MAKEGVWLWQANNEGLFTCSIQYLHGSIKNFISAIFLKHRTWYNRHIAYKLCLFGYDCPKMKGTLLVENFTFTVETVIPFEGFFWKSTLSTKWRLPKNCVSLTGIGQQLRALYSENTVPSGNISASVRWIFLRLH